MLGRQEEGLRSGREVHKACVRAWYPPIARGEGQVWPKDGGTCDKRKALGEAVRGLGGISGYTALREKGSPRKGENLLTGGAFFNKRLRLDTRRAG